MTTRLTATAAAVIALATATATATAAPSPTHRHTTPSQCIIRNGGDHNACNVGNSGRVDLPYQSTELDH